MMHRTDVVSLVFGLLFVAGAGVWAVLQVDLITPAALSFVLPAALIVIGFVGIGAALVRQRTEHAALSAE
jgi:hypothetical protein